MGCFARYVTRRRAAATVALECSATVIGDGTRDTRPPDDHASDTRYVAGSAASNAAGTNTTAAESDGPHASTAHPDTPYDTNASACFASCTGTGTDNDANACARDDSSGGQCRARWLVFRSAGRAIYVAVIGYQFGSDGAPIR